MSTYSRNDLATRAMRKAGLVDINETLSASDLEYASEGIASDTAALAIEGILIDNGSDQSVPLEHLEPRADYHAVTFMADYGLISPVDAEQAKSLKRPRLYRLCAKPATGAVLSAEYY